MMFDLGQEVTREQCLSVATQIFFAGKIKGRGCIDEVFIFAINDEVYIVVDGIVCTISSFVWMIDPFIKWCEKKALTRYDAYTGYS